MKRSIATDYNRRETQEVSSFVDALRDNVVKSGTFDSAAATDFLAIAQNQSGGSKIPTKLQAVLDEAKPEDGQLITRAILDGVGMYEEAHGISAPADVVEQALHLAYATTNHAKRRYSLDSAATSDHHDQLSLQPNRAVVAILSAMGEAIPFAHYLPADIGSNEARLAILTHQAGGAYGRYAANGIMDGTYSGDAYITSSRIHTILPSDGTGDPDPGDIDGKLTQIQTDEDTCDQAATGVKLLRGRTLVYVRGRVVATETSSSGSGASVVSGSVTLDGTTHVISGSVNTDTGVIALTSSPAIPDDEPVTVEGFIDYERDASIVPRIITAVDVFTLYAKPWRVITQTGIDARTQMSSELGLDPYSESIVAINAQFANERHYEVLHKALRLSANNVVDFDFEWADRSAQMNRAQIWRDFSSVLGATSQQMAIDTMNHGITHLYVGKNVAAQFSALPADIFQPSGVSARPGIFRLGRLFGQYEVYYTPKGLTDSASASQILCVGRATDVTRNPFILGDAVPPTIQPIAMGSDMKNGAAFYARNFTAVNPHGPSALGCARIDVTNLS